MDDICLRRELLHASRLVAEEKRRIYLEGRLEMRVPEHIRVILRLTLVLVIRLIFRVNHSQRYNSCEYLV